MKFPQSKHFQKGWAVKMQKEREARENEKVFGKKGDLHTTSVKPSFLCEETLAFDSAAPSSKRLPNNLPVLRLRQEGNVIISTIILNSRISHRKRAQLRRRIPFDGRARRRTRLDTTVQIGREG